jgi:hypothetical protein
MTRGRPGQKWSPHGVFDGTANRTNQGAQLEADLGRPQPDTRRDLGSGRLALGHRFPVVGVRRSYRLRARVPSEPSYPYATGHSQPVRITILASR